MGLFFCCVCVFTPLLEQAAYTLPPSIIWLLVHSAHALRLATEWSLVSGGPGFPGKGQGLRSQKRLLPQTTDPSGCPRGSAPGGHLCCGLMGITRYFLQILQGERGHTASIGCGPSARGLWPYTHWPDTRVFYKTFSTWNTAPGGQQGGVRMEGYRCNQASVNPTWPPELSVPHNPRNAHEKVL